MVLEFNQVNEILKKQPIGYYLGRSVKVSLQNSNNSYYSLSKDEIVISYPRLVLCFKELIKRGITIDTKTAVRIIRSILYHELGHTMLTPKQSIECCKRYNKEYMNVINIVEDERIEWILDGYIKNVNFKELVELSNAGNHDNSVINQFFDLVRLNKYEPIWSYRVDSLLVQYSNITYSSDYYKTRWYLDDVIELYKDYKREHQNEDEDNNQNESNESDYDFNLPFGMSGNGGSGNINSEGNSSDSESSGNSSSDGNSSDSDNSESSSGSPSNGNSERSKEEQEELQKIMDKLEKSLSGNPEEGLSDSSKELLKELLSNLDISDEDIVNFDDILEEVNAEEPDGDPSKSRTVGPCKSPAVIFKDCTTGYVNDKLYQELSRIFNSVNKVHKMNSSAVNAYSGIIDPRSAGRDDYKFFVQRNRGGNNKAFSKVHLNLFLDRSGSFYPNEHTANEIIHTLTKIEKMNPNFDYTFVTIGETPRIEDKKNIYYQADGGNDLTDEVPKVFKEVQVKNAVNYNLVLFDGFACWRSSHMHNWEAFNTNNTLIISDPENADPITQYCKNARVIITKNYTDELIDNIIKTLSSIVR